MLQCSDHFLGQVKRPRSVVRDLGGILEVESRELVRECQFRIGSIVGPEGRRRSSLESNVAMASFISGSLLSVLTSPNKELDRSIVVLG